MHENSEVMHLRTSGSGADVADYRVSGDIARRNHREGVAQRPKHSEL